MKQYVLHRIIVTTSKSFHVAMKKLIKQLLVALGFWLAMKHYIVNV
jgi:hypothetical protein